MGGAGEEGIANGLCRGRKRLEFGFPDVFNTFSVVMRIFVGLLKKKKGGGRALGLFLLEITIALDLL